MTPIARVLGYVALTALGSLALSACIVRARTPGLYVNPSINATVVAQPVQTTYIAPAAPVYVQPAQPTYAAPVVAACGGCQQGSFERCNGCDDNCNGVIDEDCH